MALLRVSHGSQSGLTSQNGNHGNANRGLPVAVLAADALRRGFEMVFFGSRGSYGKGAGRAQGGFGEVSYTLMRRRRRRRRAAQLCTSPKRGKLFHIFFCLTPGRCSRPSCGLFPNISWGMYVRLVVIFFFLFLSMCVPDRLVRVCVRARACDRQLNCAPISAVWP